MEQQISIWQSLSWKSISDRTKDLVIAIIIAFIGLLGSYLILNKSIKNDISASGSESSIRRSENTNIFSSKPKLSTAPKSSNENLLVVQGLFFPEHMLEVSFMEYKPTKKYMIDYGNGIRQISKSSTSYIKYQEPGIYYILFYEMIEERWEIVSSQAITIKSQMENSNSF